MPPTTPSPATTAAPSSAQLMLLFDRLLTGGALYPQEHVSFRRAVDAFHAGLEAAGGDGLVLTEAGEQLQVGTELLGPSVRGVERVAGLLEKLGLHRITVRPDAAAPALHQLATALLGHKREADASGHLAEADFGDLPDSVQVVPKVFARQWAEVGAASVGEAVDAILDDLAARGTGNALLQDARRTLESVFDLLMASSREALTIEPDPATRAQEADISVQLAEGARSLGAALRALLEKDGSLERLARAIEKTAADANSGIDRTAARLLLQALGGRDGPDGGDDQEVEPRNLADDSEYEVPLAELKRELAAFSAADGDVGVRDACEDLFIYVNVLAVDAEGPGGARALAELGRHLRAWPEPETVPELQQAVRSLLAGGDHANADPVVERIAALVRERGFPAVITFWSGVCAVREAGLAAGAWPHLVCEFLAAPAEHRETMRALQVLATNPDALADPGVLARVERLQVFGEVRAGLDFFGRPERRYFPVYAALLQTSRGPSFGRWLQEGLATAGPDRQVRAIATALGPYRVTQAALYREWLNSAVSHGDTPAQSVLDVLRRRVGELAPGERDEPWVTEAVATLGYFCPAAARLLLERIVGERRFKLFPAWPLGVREAAEKALTVAAARRERGEDEEEDA